MAKRDDQVTIEPPQISTIDDKTGVDPLLDRLTMEHQARRAGRHGVIGVSDKQLDMIMTAAAPLPAEKRSLLLERVGKHLQLFGRRNARHFSDIDVEHAVKASLLGLSHGH